MDRDELHQPLAVTNVCKHCGCLFTTLADEKDDECNKCMNTEEE